MDVTIDSIFRMADIMPGNYMIFEAQDTKLNVMYYTSEVPELSGYTSEEYRTLSDAYELVMEEDRVIIRNKIKASLDCADTQKTDLLFRMIHKTKGFIWVHMTAQKIAIADGRTVFMANLLDVTKETMISYAMMETSDRCICVIEKATKRFLYANSAFFDLIDSSPAEAMGKHCYELLCKSLDMRTNDNCLCYSSLNADPPIETYNPEKKKYLTMSGREVVWGEYDAYVFYLSDVTEKKRKEEQLLDSQKRFEVALANSDLMIWEYDMINHRCINSEKAGRDYNIPIVIENYPDSLFEMGHTPPETIAQIKDVQRRLWNGETGFSVERRTVNKYGISEWQKVEYTLECDKEGNPLRAIVCGLDITERKNLELKYEEQMEYRNKLAQNAMFSVRLDLDGDSILDYTCNDPVLQNLIQKCKTASQLLCEFFKTSDFSPESDISSQSLTAEALKETYAVGRSQYQTVYRCRKLQLYVELNLTIYKNPSSNHLEVFYVITNVTESVLTQNAFQCVMSKDYDFVAVVNAVTGKMIFLAHARAAVMPAQEGENADDYNAMVMNFANAHRSIYHSEEDYRAVSTDMLLDKIVEKLDGTPVYEFSCKTKGTDGQIHTYRLSFRYSDSTRTQIVFTRANITKMVQEEQRNQRVLEKALKAAKQADRAKTDFLSRMSHDMRTPMNGIIGMTRLTQDIPDLPAEVRSNLAAIQDSSEYLLNLINDTLDMNKIESNRFVLNPTVVNVGELVQHIIAAITTLADKKHITLQLVPINAELEYIRADRVRIQQLFLNILSNAVKFTPEHGKIRMEVECLKRENGIAYDRISVEDNGCGMSEDYLQHIYEPFSQECTRIVSGEEGTGLGMSIVKTLVDLMGGRIEIVSKLGVGTRVTVYINFERVYDVTERPVVHVRKQAVSLEGKRILLAEDHPLNATIAKRLLEKKGVLVEHAANGALALEKFSGSPLNYYDVVLMDIRMPEMDGLQATRAIRAMQRADAKTTPILAMTANAYAEDVQTALAAGMNAHLAKPIEPEALYQELERFL